MVEPSPLNEPSTLSTTSIIYACIAVIPGALTVAYHAVKWWRGSVTDGARIDLDERKQTSADRQAIIDNLKSDNRDLRADIIEIEKELAQTKRDRDRGWNKARTAYQMAREFRHSWANAVMRLGAAATQADMPPSSMPLLDQIDETGVDDFEREIDRTSPPKRLSSP